MNQQLIDYIKREEAQGYTAQQLHDWLLRYGYQEQDVNEALRYAADKNLHPALDANNPRQPQNKPKLDAAKARELLRQRQQAAAAAARGRPGVVTAAAILLWVLAGLGILKAAYFLAAFFLTSIQFELPFAAFMYGRPGFVVAAGILSICIFQIVVAIYVWKGERWARITGAILGALEPPIGWVATILLLLPAAKR